MKVQCISYLIHTITR